MYTANFTIEISDYNKIQYTDKFKIQQAIIKLLKDMGYKELIVTRDK